MSDNAPSLGTYQMYFRDIPNHFQNRDIPAMTILDVWIARQRRHQRAKGNNKARLPNSIKNHQFYI
jgi:hypothetical protein